MSEHEGDTDVILVVDGDEQLYGSFDMEDAGEELNTVTVNVEDDDGNALDGEVTIDDDETKTGESVNFELEEGEYDVTADADGYESFTFSDYEVEEDGQELTFTLEEEE